MIKIFEKLLNFIYIQPCYFCGSTKDDNIICKKCFDNIRFLTPEDFRIIEECKVFSCCIYENIIKNMIIALKYYRKKKLAYLHAKIMYDCRSKFGLNSRYTIIPVPIHKNRRKERGYNHTDLIADEYARLTGDKVIKDFIIRIKDTKRQYNLTTAERINNIKGAFAVNDKLKEPPSSDSELLIIDDITSTGTTLKEVIKTLKNAGYKNITALVLASPDFCNET